MQLSLPCQYTIGGHPIGLPASPAADRDRLPSEQVFGTLRA
jgi:hypothetical protein